MSLHAARRLMLAGRGAQFDPQLLDLFLETMPLVLRIRGRIPDPSSECVGMPAAAG